MFKGGFSAPSRCTGSMAAPGAGSLEFLTRRHGVKIDTTANLEECVLAVAALAGHENVLSASRMNNAIVIFLKTIDLANLVVESGVEIGGIFTSVLPLSTPSKKVTLSNVPPFIKNDTLAGMLARYGKLISPIKMIPIGSKSSILKHVVSFRRFVYMVLKDNTDELDLTLNFRHEDFNYVIYASTNTMRCYACGDNGHLIRACPKKVNEPNVSVSDNVTEVQNVIRERDAEMPGPSKAPVAVLENTHNSPESLESSNVVKNGLITDGAETIKNSSVEKEIECESDESESSNGENKDMAIELVNPLIDAPVLGDEGCFFKTPQKRKLITCHTDKQAKKADNVSVSQTDTDSESDISECSFSASLPQSGFSSQTYTVDDIRTFLKVTKNLRKVKIDEYFPDIMQFTEKVKLFRSESCFTDQEVYRLKKIVTKLNQLSESSENS